MRTYKAESVYVHQHTCSISKIVIKGPSEDLKSFIGGFKNTVDRVCFQYKGLEYIGFVTCYLFKHNSGVLEFEIRNGVGYTKLPVVFAVEETSKPKLQVFKVLKVEKFNPRLDHVLFRISKPSESLIEFITGFKHTSAPVSFYYSENNYTGFISYFLHSLNDDILEFEINQTCSNKQHITFRVETQPVSSVYEKEMWVVHLIENTPSYQKLLKLFKCFGNSEYIGKYVDLPRRIDLINNELSRIRHLDIQLLSITCIDFMVGMTARYNTSNSKSSDFTKFKYMSPKLEMTLGLFQERAETETLIQQAISKAKSFEVFQDIFRRFPNVEDIRGYADMRTKLCDLNRELIRDFELQPIVVTVLGISCHALTIYIDLQYRVMGGEVQKYCYKTVLEDGRVYRVKKDRDTVLEGCVKMDYEQGTCAFDSVAEYLEKNKAHKTLWDYHLRVALVYILKLQSRTYTFNGNVDMDFLRSKLISYFKQAGIPILFCDISNVSDVTLMIGYRVGDIKGFTSFDIKDLLKGA